MDARRTERISEAIREELSELIGYEMSDPRVAAAIVTQVHVSTDARRAQVMLGFADQDEAADALLALENARHFLRVQLSQRLGLFHTPELHFAIDAATGIGERMKHIMKRVRRGRARDGAG